MEQSNQCLFVGIQDTGKSSYLGAFWAIESDGQSGHALTFNGLPPNSEYLESLGSLWLQQEPVNRSPMNSHEMEICLKHRDTGSVINLAIPDFKGERFKLILQNDRPSEIDKWLKKSNKIIFFLPPLRERVFNEEYGENENQDAKMPDKDFSVDEIEPWIQIVELLKFIYEEKGDIKIAFCVYKWDELMPKGLKVEKWIEQEHLFFYTYIKYHFSNSNVKFYGVSAQGLNYENRGDLTEAKVSELTEKGKRAYISSGTDKDYDITKPLAWLLED